MTIDRIQKNEMNRKKKPRRNKKKTDFITYTKQELVFGKSQWHEKRDCSISVGKRIKKYKIKITKTSSSLFASSHTFCDMKKNTLQNISAHVLYDATSNNIHNPHFYGV